MARNANGKFIRLTKGPKSPSGQSLDTGEPISEVDRGVADAPQGLDPAAITAARTGAGASEGSEAPKRGRGRPKKENGPETERAPRAERASASTQAQGSSNLDVNGLTFILLSLHTMTAASFNAEELKLTEDEARSFASASCNVAQYYNVSISEKTQAWLALMFIAGKIYYPRFSAIRQRSKDKNPRAAHRPPSNATSATPQPRPPERQTTTGTVTPSQQNGAEVAFAPVE